MGSPDLKLVKRLQANEVAAFDCLYWKYHETVYRNIVKITRQPVVAEDILQEVFTRFWEKRQDISAVQPVLNWLLVVSFNLSVDHTRKRLREQVLHKHLQLVKEAGASAISYEEQYRLLKNAIGQLSPQKQRIITLCKLKGMTYEEAAAELKISRHTVKEYLSAAMSSIGDYVRQQVSSAAVGWAAI